MSNQTKVERKNANRLPKAHDAYVVDDFSFSAETLAAIGIDDRADEVLSHIYPQGVVVGHLSRE
jgi:hypothetical protein